MVSDKDTIWHTGLRLIYQLQALSTWVSHHELRSRLIAWAKESKEDKIDLHRLKTICPKIPSAQVDLLFEDCQNRIKSTVERGRKNMLSEALASILLGTEDLRQGVRAMKEWRQGISYYGESPLDGFEDASGSLAEGSSSLAEGRPGSGRAAEGEADDDYPETPRESTAQTGQDPKAVPTEEPSRRVRRTSQVAQPPRRASASEGVSSTQPAR